MTGLRVEADLRGSTWEAVSTDEHRQTIAAAIGASLTALAADLGLPISPEVTVRDTPDPDPDGWCLALRVEDRPVRYRWTLQAQVGTLIGVGEPGSVEQLAAAAAELCREAVAGQASVLLTAVGAAEIAGAIRDRGTSLPPVDGAWLDGVLRGLLDLGIAVGDPDTIAATLDERDDDDPSAALEALVARLAGSEVRVELPADLADALRTPDDAWGALDGITFVADAMLRETGLVVPPLVVHGTAAGRNDAFTLRINDVTSTFPLLPADRIVTDASADLVTAAVEGADPVPARFPITGSPGCETAATYAEDLLNVGANTWDRPGHVVLTILALLRHRVAWCVQQDRLQAQLDTLEAIVPKTVLAVRGAVPSWRLSALVRSLVLGRVPLTHFPSLLQRLLELPYLDLPDARLNLLGDPVTSVGAAAVTDRDRRVETFVRTGLCGHNFQTWSSGRDLLQVYLLAPAIEDLVRTERDHRRVEEILVRGVATQLRAFVHSHRTTLLVADDVRPDIGAALRHALPLVTVAGYGDLPADGLVAPVDRLDLEGADR
ncbi:FHIPEP family type III secretion protein [Cryptosporangium aurantiacum]|uniref:FHIPEP family protein n=1 Tax=Cryptosporangium aurantiacum TaxID=134849 RepID=A0A1M7KUT9_9ACTN|nr:FHIPEP family type III secretion protein [Cryptosporangium aurantiacum]SHM69340.1 FHIPEP family protein [Cryptosporangium aurantiacum]